MKSKLLLLIKNVELGWILTGVLKTKRKSDIWFSVGSFVLMMKALYDPHYQQLCTLNTPRSTHLGSRSRNLLPTFATASRRNTRYIYSAQFLSCLTKQIILACSFFWPGGFTRKPFSIKFYKTNSTKQS